MHVSQTLAHAQDRPIVCKGKHLGQENDRQGGKQTGRTTTCADVQLGQGRGVIQEECERLGQTRPVSTQLSPRCCIHPFSSFFLLTVCGIRQGSGRGDPVDTCTPL